MGRCYRDEHRQNNNVLGAETRRSTRRSPIRLSRRLEALRHDAGRGRHETLDLTLAASDCDSVEVVHKPRLLSDNGSSYVAGDLADGLEDKGMCHIRGARHPQTQGQIDTV
jgi:transposase InsO family protein